MRQTLIVEITLRSKHQMKSLCCSSVYSCNVLLKDAKNSASFLHRVLRERIRSSVTQEELRVELKDTYFRILK